MVDSSSARSAGGADPTPEAGAAEILLNDFGRQWADVGGAALEAVQRVGASGWYILGKEVAAFESALADLVRRARVVGCASGLDAIELALRAAGLRPGQRVLTTPLSAFATTLAIVRAGGVPVFVDVDEFGLIDLAQCRAVLARDASIRFLVPVHLYGHALNSKALAELARDFELVIIEDCAQSIGAEFEGQAVGTLGRAAALSFYPTKNLGAMGDAGAIACDDAEFAARCRALANYGQTERYRHELVGMNSRLDELQAALLQGAMLPKLQTWTQRRRAIAAAYRAGLNNPHVTVPGAPAGSASVWHLFPVLVAARDGFREHLANCGVQSAIHYPISIPAQAAMKQVPHEVALPLTRAQTFTAHEVSLPIHPYLSDVEVERVIAVVNRWQP
ncbi:MAG: DegT/DnrJ/EryC1/StrS family aminotransferase [Myxococcota bacterium]